MSGFQLSEHEVSIQQEIENISMKRPLVLLLGAGASKAAMPKGDKNGKPLPVLRDLAESLELEQDFPDELRELARIDFETAYSTLFVHGESKELRDINSKVTDYFKCLELPNEVNLYDSINLSLRKKDIIATFNWDPFLVYSQRRLARLGVIELPQIFFLHGNVVIGYCKQDDVSGFVGNKCSHCGNYFMPSKLLFPVEQKNYQDGDYIEREWNAIRFFLKHCFMFSVFGYSAPKTDVEAIGLLKDAWGQVKERALEQTEIISRPGANHEALRDTWKGFIHTHHFEIHESFYDSFIAKHPRRAGEAYLNQFIEAKFITDNPIPITKSSLYEYVKWFQPLLDFERANQVAQ